MNRELLLGIMGELLKVADDEGNVVASKVSTLSPLRVGNNVLIRTVTHYHTGHIEEITDTEVVLSSAAWVADMARFYTALSTGELLEVEPFADVIVSVNRGWIIDVANWAHELPKVQK